MQLSCTVLCNAAPDWISFDTHIEIVSNHICIVKKREESLTVSFLLLYFFTFSFFPQSSAKSFHLHLPLLQLPEP